MVTLLPGNDLNAIWLAGGLRVVADKLQKCVVGIRTRVAQKDTTILHRHHRRQLIGELNGRRVGLAAKHVAEAQLSHLAFRGLNDLLVAVAQRRAPQPGHPLEVALALLVINVGALGSGDHHGLGHRRVGGGVNH